MFVCAAVFVCGREKMTNTVRVLGLAGGLIVFYRRGGSSGAKRERGEAA